MKSTISFVKDLFKKNVEVKDYCGQCRHLSLTDSITVESYSGESSFLDENFFFCVKKQRYVKLTYDICENFDKVPKDKEP